MEVIMANRSFNFSQTASTVDVNGARLTYDLAGDGSPLILIHAGVCDRRMWDDQFPVLAERFRVLRYDVRGFGESTNPPGSFAHHEDLLGLMDALGFEQATLVAVSMAGQIALNTALTYPDRVRGLILSTTNAGAAAPTDAIKQIWQDADAAYESGDIAAAVEIEARAWVDGPHRSASEVDSGVRARVNSMNTALWERIADEPDAGEEVEFDPPIPARLAEIRVPTLLIVGDLDQPMTVESMALLGQGIPHAETVVIHGTGHLPSMERPDEFNRQVLSFLERHHL
jgi:3-oxoadipate enol-lactonase